MNKPSALALAVVLASFAPAANALCIGGTIVTATPMSFLFYDPLSPNPKIAVGSITFGCGIAGLLPNATIKLSSGNSTGFAPRQLKSGAKTLNYNLYTDTGQVWGDGSPGTVTKAFSALLSLGVFVYPIEGRIPAGQDAAPGTYNDSISVTVEF